MPIPQPHKDEKQDEFIARCMSDETMRGDYQQEQRAAVCFRTWRDRHATEAKAAASELRAVAESANREFKVAE